MYTERNYKSKKELVTAFASGKIIGVFQPGPFGGGPINGQECIEGPHYPEPHRFYVTVTCKDSVIVAIDGKTAEQTKAKLDKALAKKAANVRFGRRHMFRSFESKSKTTSEPNVQGGN
jgi:hypothetical protein